MYEERTMQHKIFTENHPDFTQYLRDNTLSHEGVAAFQRFILEYYYRCGRDFSWRRRITPYRIFVSEIMLQQTQTKRVAHKFEPFITAFPTFSDLAHASFQDVLAYWQGLGYNRRALGLHKSAQKVVFEYDGYLPEDIETLQTFPSIGPNTAASIATFAFNHPTVFFETNIRTVFIYHFFGKDSNISDDRLYPLVEQTVYRENPRIWYYALMDYGVYLKQQYGNFNRRSKHYTTQSQFEGSERQIRGMILRVLTQEGSVTYHRLCNAIDREEHRIQRNLQDLCSEGFIRHNDPYYILGQ